MKQRRLVWLFGFFLSAFFLVTGRLFLLACNDRYARRAENQTVTRLELDRGRGGIYDRKGKSITGGPLRYFALSVPGESSYAGLFSHVSYQGQTLLYEKRNALSPFLIEVDSDLTKQGIRTYAVPRRYQSLSLARHLVGYLDGDGRGAAGLEAAFDGELSRGGGSWLECTTTARGQLMDGSEPALSHPAEGSSALVLTLDSAVQRVCEGAARACMERGCILVLDTGTGKVLASVSLPDFDPDRVGESIRAGDSSLLNRPLCAYNTGSVFKPVLAAAALEKGMDGYEYECKGYIRVADQVYRCAEGRAHGKIGMEEALAKSCNCFFIDLGQKLGGAELEAAAERFGFGKAVHLAGGMKSAAGSLPTAGTLKNLGELANFSFGQGQLTAAPIQVAAAFNVIASDGVYRRPAFLEKLADERTGETEKQLWEERTAPCIRPETARKLRTMLCGVVETGLGRDAQPEYGGAGGKTGTAQTGQFDEEGRERMNYWFAGFYPAETPRYTVLVMQDGITEPKISSGTVFARVCDGLYWLSDLAENS